MPSWPVIRLKRVIMGAIGPVFGVAPLNVALRDIMNTWSGVARPYITGSNIVRSDIARPNINTGCKGMAREIVAAKFAIAISVVLITAMAVIIENTVSLIKADANFAANFRH